ncbi:MAG TPA: ABC transporter substrate-binding protein [Chloroflexota bacterium]|nr:ABC transporter substrate-binding protein [Chloroflexota bacterium]
MSRSPVQPRRAPWRLLVATALATSVLTSAPDATHAANPGPDTLVIAADGAPTDLDPATSYDGPSALLMRGLYEGLVRMKGASTTQIEGSIATSWASSQGGKVWTFQLRHNDVFHDGTPVTAEAVKESIVRTLTINQGPAFIPGTFVAPSGISAIGPYTLRFTLKAASDVFPRALAAQWGNWIVSPTAIKKYGKKLHTWLQTHDAGSGPYVLSQITAGQSATLTRFDRYWGGWSGHHVSRVIINNVIATATRRELVEKGDADITQRLTSLDLLAISKEPNLKVDRSYGMTNLQLVMTEAGPLASAKARQAMAYAFDYNAFINDLLKGYGRQAQGPLPRTFLGHDLSLPLYKTDLNKAKSLLQEAGVAPGTTMTLWYQAEDEVTKDAAQVMQAQLAQLGITLKTEVREATAFVSMYYGNTPPPNRPNFFVWYWYPDYNDPGDWLYPQYYSKEAGSAGANGGFYKNATVDKLLDQAALLSDTKQRLKLYDQVQRILYWDDPAAVYLADLPESVVYRSNVHGYYLNPVYTATFDVYNLWKS